MDNPKTLLMHLTAENPICSCEEDSDFQSNGNTTKDKRFYSPSKMTEWKDFNYTNLSALYNGAAVEKLSTTLLDPFPRVINQDLEVEGEPGTVTIYDAWYRPVVCKALETVSRELHPCTWKNSSRRFDPSLIASLHFNAANKIALKRRPASKPKASNEQASIGRGSRKYKRKQDSGSGAYCKKCKDPVDFERLPKEYKFAKSWSSSQIHGKGLVDAEGNWIRMRGKTSAAWAIRQAYTYCVDHLCRYGAILTTEEAFIFRIQPLGPQPKFEKDSPQYLRELRRQLVDGGTLEYVSVKHGAHWAPPGNPTGVLTINLALWYLHVLAGNDHRTYWALGDLASEKLKDCRGSAYHTPPPPNAALVLSPEGRFVPASLTNENACSSRRSTSTETAYNLRPKRKAKERGGDPQSARSRDEHSPSTSTVGQEPHRMRSDTLDALRDAQIALPSPRKRKKATRRVEQDPSDHESSDTENGPTSRKRRGNEDYLLSFTSVRSYVGSQHSDASPTNTTQPNTQTSIEL